MTEAPGKLDSKYILLTEGKATVLFENENQVFYNPVQQFNRDLSTCAIRAWSELYLEERRENRKKLSQKRKQKKLAKIQNKKDHEVANKTLDTRDLVEDNTEPIVDLVDQSQQQNSDPFITILEALSATGLRAIRYGLEIPLVKKVVANDLSPSATAAITRNIEYNIGASQTVVASQGDANTVMYNNKQKPFHIVDLDPYGTAVPFLDAAVQSVANNGMLLVTCTDLAILAGTGYPEKCYSGYGGMTTRTEFSHESALRLVLHAISSAAARYGKSIEPLLSLSIDFYVRVFVKVRNSPLETKLLASKTMITYTCTGCGSISSQTMGKSVLVDSGSNDGGYKHGWSKGPPVSEHCVHCGFIHHLGGPMWAGPLHNKNFISKIQTIANNLDSSIYKTIPRIKAMTSLASEELDAPFYFTTNSVASIIHCDSPPMAHFSSALLNAGYKVSPSHAKPGAIKTDASWNVIWDILRAWVKSNPVNEDNLKPNSPAKKILSVREPSFEVDFTPHAEANPPSRKIKIARYPENPPNWGPKARAKGDRELKRESNQGPKHKRDDTSSIQPEKKVKH
ncbi:N2,N2-dimethylguanosine tRNA methyltransferase-domain-containing protein [Lipomyces japonicus]|uniref:N2,N2-dimethylguanosine tRNA methyltransferase-domain-containing protein n=1 Tax=Lipomyces japonicus TaxID=56871 RepID=UPI0034CD6F2C